MLLCSHAKMTNFFNLRNVFYTFGLFYVNDYPFLMMVWNIVLAMVPFGFFLLLSGYWRKTGFKKISQRILAGAVFFFWLIFLPNAAYLIADIRHLLNFCPADSYVNICVSGAWEIMFFFVYSVFGWVFFTIHLIQMRHLLEKILGQLRAKIIILSIIPVMSLGVLFGLTERFNSWDLFVHPLAISQYLLRYMTSWEYFRNWLAFTAGYYILYFFGNYLFTKKIK
jgi:uncharacterized membrane protein